MFTSRYHLMLALLAAPGVTFIAQAAPKTSKHTSRATKPAAKPKQPRLIREVMGTEQLVGYEGVIGQTFTVGTDTAVNVTLKNAEYSVGRICIGSTSSLPLANEKFLVLHFTVQNPLKGAFNFTPSYLDIKAVDSSGVTRPALTDIGREITRESIAYPLNPGQKVEAYTAIRVSAFGDVPKLLVRNNYDHSAPLVRYDLRGKVGKLAPPFADASDAKGVNAPRLVTAKMGVFYPITTNLDMRLDKVEYSTEAMHEVKPESGQRYCVATVTVRNTTLEPVSYHSHYFHADLKDRDGEKVPYNGDIRKATRDESGDNKLAPGEEARFRFYWLISNKVEAQTVLLQDGYEEESRIYALEVGGAN